MEFRLKATSALFLCLGLISSCKKSAPPDVAATVNGSAVTFAEVEKQLAMQFPQQATSGGNDDQVMIQKMEILRTMIDRKIMLQRAEKLGLMAVDSDVDTKVSEFKAPYTQEEFQKQLTAKKMSVEDLRSQIRIDLSIEKLINKEITSQINISDKDVTEFYAGNKASFNLAEPQVHMAQILVTSAPDANVRNLKNDKSQNDDQAKKKMQLIEQRIRNGEDFSMLAQNYSEDPNSAPNGGDLGYIAQSSLEQANIELRKLVMQMPPGSVSSVLRTQEGYRILKVISKEPAGQRDLNDPKVQQTIRETLLNRKDQLRRQAYYEMVRNEAKVENYLANSIVAAITKK